MALRICLRIRPHSSGLCGPSRQPSILRSNIFERTLSTFKCIPPSSYQCSRDNDAVFSSKKISNTLLRRSTASNFKTLLHNYSTSRNLYTPEPTFKTEDGYLVYVGDSGAQLKRLQCMLYVTGAIVLGCTPFLVQKAGDSMFMSFMIQGFSFFVGVVNPLMLYKVGQRYVQELYYNEETDTYTALVLSPFVIGNRKVVFTPHDCKMSPTMTLFTSFLVKGKPMFINSDIMDYNAYSRMLRYAKEFDYENPDRQTQYQDSVQESIERIKKKKGSDV